MNTRAKEIQQVNPEAVNFVLNEKGIKVKSSRKDYVRNAMKLKLNFILCQCKMYETYRNIMYDSVNNSPIPYSDHYVTFFILLSSHDGHLLKAVGQFIQDCSVI